MEHTWLSAQTYLTVVDPARGSHGIIARDVVADGAQILEGTLGPDDAERVRP